MDWFRGVPKQNGFYWLSRDGMNPTIVRVYDLEEGLKKHAASVSWIGSDWDSSLVDVMKEYKCKWMGPL